MNRPKQRHPHHTPKQAFADISKWQAFLLPLVLCLCLTFACSPIPGAETTSSLEAPIQQDSGTTQPQEPRSPSPEPNQLPDRPPLPDAVQPQPPEAQKRPEPTSPETPSEYPAREQAPSPPEKLPAHWPKCDARTMALWLSPGWNYAPYPKQATETLRNILLANKVNKVFSNVSLISSDGYNTVYDNPPISIRNHNKYLKQVLPILQRGPQKIKVFAWLSASTDPKRRGYVNLSTFQFQTNLLKLAQFLLQLGFDGIHLNIEPVPDIRWCPKASDCQQGYNKTYIAFLSLLRRLQSIGKHRISVTTGSYYPTGGGTLWSADAYKQVIPYTGELVVMNYDLGILAPTTAKYQQTLFRAAVAITDTLKGQSSSVLFGLPNYLSTPGNVHHRPHETLANTLGGLRPGKDIISRLGGFAMYTEQNWTYPTGKSFSMQNFKSKPDWKSWKDIYQLGCRP